MEEQENFFGETKKKVEEYLQERLLLFKLQAVEKMSMLISALFLLIVIMLFGFFILLFLSIMAAYYFASVTGSVYLGFGIVAGFYVLLFVIVLILRKRLLNKLMVKTLMDVFFDPTNEDVNEE